MSIAEDLSPPHETNAERARRRLKNAVLAHFIPSVFLGIVCLEFIKDILHFPLEQALREHPFRVHLIAALLNGLAVAGLIWLFHWERLRRYKKRKVFYLARPLSPKQRKQAVWISFTTAFLSTTLFFSPWGMLLLPAILWAIFLNLRVFTRRVLVLLLPDRAITWEDAWRLIQIYLNMLIAFTMINASLQWISLVTPGAEPAFNSFDPRHFILDALYFSVTLMTTVGFGDIHPTSYVAKALVTFECLTSYFMFALTVGCITRGVIPTPKNIPDPWEKAREEPSTPPTPSKESPVP